MKVVLRSDVEGLGTAGQVLDVADGYARNHLMPRNLAMPASKGVLAQAAEMARARQQRDQRSREAAEAMAAQLTENGLTVTARAGAGGQLYGSITNGDIADAVQALTGVEVDRRTLTVDPPIRSLGEHEVGARPHAEVQFAFTVAVVAEED
ncbi:MAG TPA: 50S ribosomal protein L9 [Acidimicrobiaceae bacterium]|nr:50S ribosomal protein L9 [Acidimicrobiaceae bacterium]HCB37837.1 50S ribosomal protein L9 [Acidimicrobiaceae bacterium]